MCAFDLSFSPSPLRIATAWDWTNKEDGVCVFDPDKQKTIALVTPYKTHIERLALTPDGTRLAVATANDMDGSERLEVYDLFLGVQNVPEFSASQTGRDYPLGPVTLLAFNGRHVAGGISGSASFLLWDTETQRPPHSDEELVVDLGVIPNCLAFAPGDTLLLAGNEGFVRYAMLPKQSTRFDRSGPAVTALAVNAEGRSYAVGTEWGTVEFWDAANRRCMKTFSWEEGAITALAFAADCSTCAAGTSRGTVIVWDLDK